MLALAALLFAGTALAQPPVTIDDAWVRAAPPAATVMSGYFTVHNESRAAVTLTRVESPNFTRVEIHRSTMVDGVARMDAVETVEIPAGSHAEFAPGGLHLMLIEPLGAMPVGKTAYFILTFDNGWTLEVTAPVRRPD